MKSTVSIAFGAAEVVVDLPTGEAAGPADEARRWLDERFIAYDCTPLRASGKVLTADKLLAIAGAIGQRGFEQDEALRMAYARAAVAALARPMVRVDVDALAVSF